MQSIKMGSKTERLAMTLPESNIEMRWDAAEWCSNFPMESRAREKVPV